MDRHSKLPHFLRMHGSVLPRMLAPLVMIGGWATCITCISKFVTSCRFSGHHTGVRRANIMQVGVSTLLLTVLGFVVGLALSFRSSTAYERYVTIFS
jgi:putative membrane protein